MGWRSRIDNQEYRNWLAVGHGLSLMCDGVRPYLDREMKAFHRQLQLAVGAGIKCMCVHMPRRKPNPWHDMIGCKWAVAIKKYYTGNPKKIAWNQSKSNLWDHPINGPWEIAKLFMPDLGPDGHLVVDAQSTDATGLINLMMWCKFIGVPLKKLADDVRKIRNTQWAHVPNQKLSNAEKKKAFEGMEKLLQSPKFAADHDAIKYLTEIQAVEEADMVTMQRVEANVLHDFKNILEQDVRRNQATLQSINKDIKKLVKTRERSTSTSNTPFQVFSALLFQTVSVFCKSVCRKIKVLLFAICLVLCVQYLGNGTLSDSCSFQQGENSTFQEFDFTSSLQLAREHFTGRQWLFRQIEEKIEGNDTKAGVLVTGASGSGKSALIAQLICSRTSSIFIHNNIIGYHICSYYNKETQNVVKFVRNMVHMIAQRVTKYRQIITQNAFIKEKLIHLCPINPAACFRKVVLDPLEQIEDENLTVGFRYIVIDALDECTPSDTQGASDILTMIRKHLPSLPRSVKMILTSRPMPRILKLHFVAVVDINPSDPKNIDDIDSYIARRVYMKYSSFVAFSLRVMSGIDDRQNLLKIMNKLVNQSQGNFLFAREVIQFCLTSPTENDGSLFLPQTLGDIYQKYFERAFPTRSSFTSVRPILELLVATAVPLKSKDMFTMIVNEDNPEIKSEYEFESSLNQLSHFLRFDRTTRTVNLYHKALADWLTSSDMKGEHYYVYKKEGCRLLASHFLNRFIKKQVPITADMVIQITQYISCAGKLEKHIEMFKSLPSHKIRSLKTSHESLLHTAALTEDTFVSKLVIYHFKDVNIVDRRGFTPAFLATIHGLLENLETFYRAGANINHVSNPCPNDATKTLQELYPKILNWGKLLKRRFCHLTMIRTAIVGSHVRIVRFLIEKGVNLDDESKVLPIGSVLDLAAEIGNLAIVQLLYNAWRKDAGSSLRYATQNNRTAIVKYFLESEVQDKCLSYEGVRVYTFPRIPGQEVYYRESHIIDYETALHIAVRKAFTQLVQLFLTHGGTAINCSNKNGLLPIHYAVLANNSELVQILLKKKATINAPCDSNLSNSTKGHANVFLDPVVKLVDPFERDNMHLVVDNGSKFFVNIQPLEQDKRVNTTCRCGMNPLHFAAKFGLVEMVTLLVDNGANISGQDCNGSTALHIAACHNQLVIFKKLVEKGADPNTRSFNGSTPFHSAALCAAKEIFFPIHTLGANAYLRDNSNMTVVHYATLFRENSQPLVSYNQYNIEDRTKYLLSEKWLESFLFLIQSVVSPNLVGAVDHNGQTVLHILATCGLSVGVYQVLRFERANKLNLLNGKDNFGNTALDLALARVGELVSQRRLNTGEFIAHSFIPRLGLSGDYDIAISQLIAEMNDTESFPYFVQFISHPLSYSMSEVLTSKNGIAKSTEGRLKVLLSYLRTQSVQHSFLISRNKIPISVTCDQPFNQSVFHLLSSRMTDFGNWFCQMSGQWSTSGTDYVSIESWKLMHLYFYTVPATNYSCLNYVLTAKEREKDFLGSCMDSEGYSPLHRAAQGSNLLAIQEFMTLDLDIFTKTRQGFDALQLSILYSVKVNLQHSVELTFENIEHALDIATLDIKLATKVAITLLREALRKGFTLRCKKGLTVYHYAASRGMVELIKVLFQELNLSQADRICEDKNRITPFYLAQLYETFFFKSALHISPASVMHNPWKEVTSFIKGNENVKDRNLKKKRTAELFLMYSYLYKDFMHPFQPNLTLDVIRGLTVNTKRKECKSVLHSFSHFTLGSMTITYMKVTNTMFRTLWNLLLLSCTKYNYTSCYVSQEYYYEAAKPFYQSSNAINLMVNVSMAESNISLSHLLVKYFRKMANISLLKSARLNCAMKGLLIVKQLFYKYIYIFAKQRVIMPFILQHLRIIKAITDCRYIISHGEYVVSAFTAYVKQQHATQGNVVPKISEFVRNRMDWHGRINEHIWPLSFLVRIINNDTARYDYLKTLNIGI